MHKLRSFIIAIITFVIVTIMLYQLQVFLEKRLSVNIVKPPIVKQSITDTLPSVKKAACEKCKSNDNKVCVNNVCMCKKGYVWLDKTHTICGVPKPPIKPIVTVTPTYETQPIRIRTTITKEIDHKNLDVVLSFPLDKKAFLNTNPKLRLKVVRSSDQKPVFTKFCNVQDGWNKVVIPKSNFIDNYGGLYTATLYYGDTENVAHVDFRPTE